MQNSSHTTIAKPDVRKTDKFENVLKQDKEINILQLSDMLST